MKTRLAKLFDYRVGSMEIPRVLSEGLRQVLKSSVPGREELERVKENLRNIDGRGPIPQERRSRGELREQTRERERNRDYLDPDIDVDQFTTKKGVKTEKYVSPHTFQYGPREAQAYLSLRFLPSYIAVYTILSQLSKRVSMVRPRSVVDYGCGPGSGIWAAREVFGEKGMKKGLAVDVSESMLDMIRNVECAILEQENKESERDTSLEKRATFELATRRYMTTQDKHDLVIAAYILSDLPSQPIQQSTLKQLWENTLDTLVIVENGSDSGFRVVAAARQFVLDLENGEGGCGERREKKIGKDERGKRGDELGVARTGAHVVAPCPHDMVCPLLSTTHFCFFSQHYQIRKELKATAGIKAGVSGSSYSYVVIRRGVRPTSASLDAETGFRSLSDQLASSNLLFNTLTTSTFNPSNTTSNTATPTTQDSMDNHSFTYSRILTSPKKKKGHVILRVCEKDGKESDLIVSKRAGEVYGDARKSRRGDLWCWEREKGRGKGDRGEGSDEDDDERDSDEDDESQDDEDDDDEEESDDSIDENK